MQTAEEAFAATGMKADSLMAAHADPDNTPGTVPAALPRRIAAALPCQESTDGDQAEVCRAIGQTALRVRVPPLPFCRCALPPPQPPATTTTISPFLHPRPPQNVDPFLMLDFFHVSKPGGFPAHPHRGFETVTWMIDGEFRHEDSMGTSDVIKSGDVQWMTAGSGVVHSEVPVADGVNSGLQLWVNLPAKLKLIPPRYQAIKAADIPIASLGNGKTAAVLAGTFMGTTGPAETHTPIVLADVSVHEHDLVEFPVPRSMQGFIYVMVGSARFGAHGKWVSEGTVLTFAEPDHAGSPRAPDDTFLVRTEDSYVRFYLGLGEPIGEPIAQGGPMVMNTQAELRQAFAEYRAGTFVKQQPKASGKKDAPTRRRHDEL